jgi:hypothetical protein
MEASTKVHTATGVTKKRTRTKVAVGEGSSETEVAESAEEPKRPQKRARKSVSYQAEVRDMLYTFGDARNCNEETVALVEAFVLSYVLELVVNLFPPMLCSLSDQQIREALRQAHRRGATRVSLNDILFNLRSDPAKLARLREFLTWKDIRKKFAKGNTTEDDKGKGEQPSFYAAQGLGLSGTRTDKDTTTVLMEATLHKKGKKELHICGGLLGHLKCIGEDDHDYPINTAIYDQRQKERLRVCSLAFPFWNRMTNTFI